MRLGFLSDVKIIGPFEVYLPSWESNPALAHAISTICDTEYVY